jgi:serine/threonine protein kinase
MFRAGDQIGPYLLVSKIGRGNFGVVWLAERRTTITTTRVALKMPLDDEIDLETIRQEADLWVQASGHPNVLPIIEANIYDDQVVIASEYAPDGSLDAWLRKHGGAAPSWELAVEMASGILAGLQHLHSRHIIHRDLKPQNLLLQGETPRLADFGISRVLKSTSQSSIVAGTPIYMAPEAFDGKRNEQTDVWSVGVIFYQLLSGHLPFPQTDITSLMGAILTRNPDPLPLSVPEPLKEVITRSLGKDTAQRYRSATETRAALRNAMELIQESKQAERVKRHKGYDPTVIATDPSRSATHTSKIFRAEDPRASVKPAKTVPPISVNTMSPDSSPRQPVRQGRAPRFVYVFGVVVALLIATVALALLLKSGNGASPPESQVNKQTEAGAQPVKKEIISTAVMMSPNCVVSYASGCCWTITPPTSPPCSGLPIVKPAVTITPDGLTCTLAVPANAAEGIRAIDSKRRQFSLHQGEQFEIRAAGLVAFSREHPCSGPEGMFGWYDPYMDSPFKQNVGGLEFSIGPLSSNRFFAGKYYYGTADYSGTPVFRIIERKTGYHDDNSGSFTVTVQKIR